jgi:hypothetical protein
MFEVPVRSSATDGRAHVREQVSGRGAHWFGGRRQDRPWRDSSRQVQPRRSVVVGDSLYEFVTTRGPASPCADFAFRVAAALIGSMYSPDSSWSSSRAQNAWKGEGIASVG